MIELILASVASATAFSLLVTGAVNWKLKGIQEKKFSVDLALAAPEPPRFIGGNFTQAAIEAPRTKIPKEIQDEIDQTPEWWSKQFHKQLEASGAKIVARGVGDEITERSFSGKVEITYHTPDRKALAGCECGDCIDVMRRTAKPRKAKRKSDADLDTDELAW